MLPLKHPITKLISGTCILSSFFILLRTLPSCNFIVCRYQCDCVGSAVSRQLSQNQNKVHDTFSQLPHKFHESFVLLLQLEYIR